ncbi:O-antigen ligase family protein [Qipengyuania marisflavi]|nr:O-antigen ligase family protein [Qipengyuania marisflavi]
MFFIALLVGGGGTPSPFPEMIVELAGLALLAWAAFEPTARHSLLAAVRREPVLTGLGIALALLMVAQIIPLPAGVWQALPGRAIIAENTKSLDPAMWHSFSVAPSLTFSSLLSLIPPFAAYLVASGTKPAQRDWLFPALALFALATIALQMLQAGGPFSLYSAGAENFSGGFQANRNAQGDILAILLSALACRPRLKGQERTTFWAIQGVLASVLLIAVVLTGSRSGLAMCLICALILALRGMWDMRRKSARAVAIVAAAGAVMLAGAAAYLVNNVTVLKTLARFGAGEEGRTAVIWPDAWYAVGQVFPWGTGFGTFVPVFKIYESQELLDSTVANRAHNEILELLIEGGWPALAIAGLALFMVLWRGWTVMRQGASSSARYRGALLMLVSVLLSAHSLVDYPIRTMSVAVVWAMLLGLVIADRADGANDGNEQVTAEVSRGKRSKRRAERRRRSPSERTRLALSLAVVAGLVPLVVLATLERARRPLPFNLSCILPTPNACLNTIATLSANAPDADLSPLTAMMAARYPANDKMQSLHGAQLLRKGDPRATLFLHNAARLGWREPLGQINAFETALSQGEIPKAVLHLDALFRTHPEFMQQPGLLDGVLADERVRQEWAARLAEGPDYFNLLMQFIARSAGEAVPEGQADGWAKRVEILALARANGLAIPRDMAAREASIVFRSDRARAADFWTALAGPGGWAEGKPAWSTSPPAGPLDPGGTRFAWFAPQGDRSPVEIVRASGQPAAIATQSSLNGPARQLASLALFMGPGGHELRWTTNGAETGDLFPSLTCENGRPPELQLLDPPGPGMGAAVVIVAEDCGGVLVTINKGRGQLAKGASISDIMLDRKRLLE